MTVKNMKVCVIINNFIQKIKQWFQKKRNSDTDDKNEKIKIRTLSVSVASDVGKKRKVNEDNFYADNIGIRKDEIMSETADVEVSERAIFAVCDGMGGEAFGKESSEIAVECLSEFCDKIRQADMKILEEEIDSYVQEANDRICQMIEERMSEIGGSTLAMVCIEKNGVVTAYNVGDSRVYILSDGKLTQITEDQTLAVKKLKANIYTPEEARTSPDSHKLTSFLGVDDYRTGLYPLTYEKFAIENNKIIICSDGLYDMCTDEEITQILTTSEEPNLAECLVRKAIENGGIDNITCIVISDCVVPENEN